MKKNLIVALALVFVLGIAGTAFAAANPFVDVPAKHWAYDAVSKLAQAGILDGYGDGTYRGERLATRYEMAQATAKAMARSDKANAQLKALIDKLAVEFAAELNNLGVRVAKLEKNASSIKFGGDSRLFFKSNALGREDINDLRAVSDWNQRVRVTATADVNEKLQFIGRWMATWNDGSTQLSRTSTDMYWDYAYFQWTFNPGFKLAVGRQGISTGQGLFNANGGYDAVSAYFMSDNNKFNARLSYGDLQAYAQTNPAVTGVLAKPVFLMDLNYKFSKEFAVNGSIYWGTDADKATGLIDSGTTAGTYATGYPFQVYNLGFTGALGSDFTLRGTYFWNVAQPVLNKTTDSHTGWMASLAYKGASYAKVNSWGLMVTYRDIKPWAIDLGQVAGYGFLTNSMVQTDSIALGQKGFGLQAEYAINKNAILTATYEALNHNSNVSTQRLLPFYYVQLNLIF